MKKITLVMSVLTLASLCQAGKVEVRQHLQLVVPFLKAIEEAGINNPVTVGNEPSCDYSVIQEAINSGADQVRIAEKGSPYYENLVITDRTVALKGNYANCDDASNDIESDVKAVIDGGQSGSVLWVESESLDMQYNSISHLVIQNGQSFHGGGMYVESQSTLFVSLDDVQVQFNTAQSQGSAIYVTSTPGDQYLAHLYLKDSVIDSNTGDVAITGGYERTILIDGETVISSNIGRGVSSTLYGRLTIFSPVTISNNQKDGDGGGLLLNDRSDLYGQRMCEQGYCFGSNSQPIRVTDNTATGNGGGVYVTHLRNYLNIHHVEFKNNSASIGGAFFIGSNNIGGFVTIDASHFEGNRADIGLVGAVIGSDNQDYDAHYVTVENSTMVKNGANGVEYLDNYLFYLSTRSNLSVTYSTIADNHVEGNLILANNGNTGVGTSVLVSIIDEPNELFYGTPGSTFYAECLLLENDNNLPAASKIMVGDPAFADAAIGNYHLTIDSPAVDFCDFIAYGATDKEGIQRGYDYTSIDDQYGPYDLGAYELSDVIFENGFE